MARLTARVVLPTPPLPDPMATMVLTPGSAVGGGGVGGWDMESGYRLQGTGYRGQVTGQPVACSRWLVALGFCCFEFGDVAAAGFGFANFAAAARVGEAGLLVRGFGLGGRPGYEST